MFILMRISRIVQIAYDAYQVLRIVRVDSVVSGCARELGGFHTDIVFNSLCSLYYISLMHNSSN